MREFHRGPYETAVGPAEMLRRDPRPAAARLGQRVREARPPRRRLGRRGRGRGARRSQDGVDRPRRRRARRGRRRDHVAERRGGARRASRRRTRGSPHAARAGGAGRATRSPTSAGRRSTSGTSSASWRSARCGARPRGHFKRRRCDMTTAIGASTGWSVGLVLGIVVILVAAAIVITIVHARHGGSPSRRAPRCEGVDAVRAQTGRARRDRADQRLGRADPALGAGAAEGGGGQMSNDDVWTARARHRPRRRADRRRPAARARPRRARHRAAPSTACSRSPARSAPTPRTSRSSRRPRPCWG